MGVAGVYDAPCHHVGVELARRLRSRVEWKRTCSKNAAICALSAVFMEFNFFYAGVALG